MAEEESLDYSIVIPVYFNEGSLVPLMEALQREILDRNSEQTCEVIFVDDGSGDGSLKELLHLRSNSPEIIKIIKLTRNFGQVNALIAGFSHARGYRIAWISADGQDPPGLIDQMLKLSWEQNYDIVAGARVGRDESFYRRITSRFFYSLMRKLCFPHMPIGGFDIGVLSRRALEVILRNQEAHVFLQGQILWTGFKIKFVDYHRKMRTAGASRWTLGKKLTYLLDGVTGFSFAPLRLVSAMGVLVALCGFLYALAVFLQRIFWATPVKGWAPLMIVVLTMGGVQMLMLGLLGEYVWRTLAQVRNRELFLIDRIYDDTEQDAVEV